MGHSGIEFPLFRYDYANDLTINWRKGAPWMVSQHGYMIAAYDTPLALVRYLRSCT